MVLADGTKFCGPDNEFFCYMYARQLIKKKEFGYVIVYFNLFYCTLSSYKSRIMDLFCIKNVDTIEGE